LDQYLQLFVNERQDDLYDLLPMAEFQHNNHVHSATQQPPFLLDTGQLPCMGFEPQQNPSALETVNEFTERMRKRYSTVVGTGEDSSTSSSGRDMAMNTIPGSPPPKSPLRNSQWSSIANTLGLRDTSDARSSTVFFIPSPLLRDVAILKGE